MFITEKNKNYIIDTSFCCSLLFPDEYNEPVFNFFKKVVSSNDNIVIPYIFVYELLNAFVSARNKGRFPESETSVFSLIQNFIRKADIFYLYDAKQVFKLCRKHDLTSYDGAYLEASLELSGVLCTLDKALLKAAKAEGVHVWEPGLTL